MTAASQIEHAFQRLSERAGFERREAQVQLSLLLSDLIEGGKRGLFEAPTGLGKSFATLVAAIAQANATGKRIVIATYTNVLAEQYWRKDLPLALSLFDEHPEAAFQIGRSRYACLIGLEDHAPNDVDQFRRFAELGIESEFRSFFRKSNAEQARLWAQVATPPVCPARGCPAFDDCYYYQGRKKAEKAKIIITNHSVVVQDALMASMNDEGEGLLGPFDYLILDEAHDFASAAVNGLEFEISLPKLSTLSGIVGRLDRMMGDFAKKQGDGVVWKETVEDFKKSIEAAEKSLFGIGATLTQGGILSVSPEPVAEHPAVQNMKAGDLENSAIGLAADLQHGCEVFTNKVDDLFQAWRELAPELARFSIDPARNYVSFVREFGNGAKQIFEPLHASVSYIGNAMHQAKIRRDLINIATPLQEMLWQRVPYACLSATMIVDGDFDHFKRVTGASADFEEVLPSPFDFSTQAALYVPPAGRIPDPTQARANDTEAEYHYSVARELQEIIQLLGGRTLVLFHSRKEMEAVYKAMRLPDALPILMQTRFGATSVGDHFKRNVHASLFALRSYWTGFDAAGETLSCVVIVRVPFEVPIDPPQLARLAYLAQEGHDPFQTHTLPNAKMLMRQGAGRLIRRETDRGLLVLLDPRLRTKRYGEAILENLPSDMRQFSDVADAIGWLGLGAEPEA